jgi:hypothetical protein
MAEESKAIPEEFTKVICDFVGDIRTTFPEYEPFIIKWLKTPQHYSHIEDAEARDAAYDKHKQTSVQLLFKFCQKKLPPRFFDILYQNEDMFKADSDVDTEFLPNIHFKNLWQCDISQKTRETIWKYLQLITFAIVGTLNNKEAFGDTAKMFEAINEDEFKSKLEETLSHMQGLFEAKEGDPTDADGESAGINMPDAEQLHGHITGMLDGKLGQLAREIAEETAANLNADFEGATDMKDVFQTLVKNPTKLMGLVKTVGDKLDSKIKSGDLKESELIAEASEMMNKMKNMPGMGNIQSMLSKMGMGDLAGMAGLGGMGGGKVNMGAMQANLDQRMKLEKTKERIRAKADSNARAKAEQEARASAQMQERMQQPVISDAELFGLFGAAEKAERTPRGAKPPPQQPQQQSSSGKKKKNGKK